MIPLRDTIRAQHFPVVNTALIILNGLIFWFEISLGPQALERLIFTYGLIPARFWAVDGLDRWLPLLTSAFLHGGWLHLISNMLALYIFGDNVEDRMGHGRYLIFYLVGGILAGLAHALVHPTSTLPTIGASGAVAAILGAYLLLYPQARVITLIPLPLFIIFPIIEIPVIFYLGFWFLSQLFSGAFALTNDTFQQGGVAWWAHVGGFIAGMILVWVFARRPRRAAYPRPYYPDEYFPW
jgi:membrane associated rhomboid family serine protease